MKRLALLLLIPFLTSSVHAARLAVSSGDPV